ncbi:MAG: hypothetical protein IH616_23025 [Gemmatimonadales bacterium]|nr:hypothetical protein [Gemmatimonadales bacterium]
MSKSDDKKLAALARKNAAKAAKPRSRVRKKYDDTLRPEDEEAQDAHRFFSQMKKREF